MQVALFAYHETLPRVEAWRRQTGLLMEKPRAFANTVLQRAMRNYYTPNVCRENDHAELDDATPGMHSHTQVSLFGLDEYFEALERACGALACTIVQNLMGPHGECAAAILAEADEKKSRRARDKARHYLKQPRGITTTLRITPRMVRDGLRLSATEWRMHMDGIRTFTRAWLARQQH